MTFSPSREGTSVETATADLLADGVGDGLPVVPPTVERWERMLDGVADPDAVVGLVPPLFGELTARAVAGCCVLAGCRPGVVPLVLTAAVAALEPEFNLLGVQTTTGTAAVGMIVAGPVVGTLGLSDATGMLGPGPHANGVVGRSLALTLATVGGVRVGETSMATTSQPARYGFCVAAAGEVPTVTVLAISGTAEVVPRDDLAAPDDVLAPLAEALGRSAGEQTLVIPPEIARRVDVARELDARVVVAGGPGVKMLHLPGWMGGSRGVTRTLG
ncbi:hypothetical protein WCD74_00985 [Actinomycetospora sp. OC33-EN08]|uniref:Uncharacterized protein n=1 Tax=Actinomycetospora aurantiaca TaxID=3129233 RepID=A0ABU8MI44_9PSEU